MGRKNTESDPAKKRAEPQAPAFDITRLVLCGIVVVLVITNVLTYSLMKQDIDSLRRDARQTGAFPNAAPVVGADSVELGDFKVVNAHDHLFYRRHLDKYLAAAKRLGITRTLFVASSEYTLMGDGHDPAEGNDANTEVILKASEELPDKIIPFCAIHPSDPEKLEKIKRYVSRGARGLKLYTGHGNFYDRPLDTEEMLPVYDYCERTHLPICWHVNLVRYYEDFRRVMERFPNLIVIVPHFGVTFFNPTAKPFRDFQYLLDTYPNLYTDTSFGTRAILVSGLEAVSRHREIFRAFFDKYSDRILFGTDMVVTGNKEKTEEWVEAVLRACRDVLEKDSFHFFMGAVGSAYADKRARNIYGAYRGLALDEKILRKVYETNPERLFPSR